MSNINKVFINNILLCILAILLVKTCDPWWISFICVLFLERVDKDGKN